MISAGAFQMKCTRFQDENGHEIRISFAGNGDVRIYQTDLNDSEKFSCMTLSHPQARMLVLAIQDLLGDEKG